MCRKTFWPILPCLSHRCWKLRLYAAQILQSEKPLVEFVAGQTQSARPVSPTEQRTVQVTKVMSSIRESPLDIKPVTDEQRTVVVSQVQPSDVIHFKHDHWAVDGEWEIVEWETTQLFDATLEASCFLFLALFLSYPHLGRILGKINSARQHLLFVFVIVLVSFKKPSVMCVVRRQSSQADGHNGCRELLAEKNRNAICRLEMRS